MCSLFVAMINIIFATTYLCDVIKLEHRTSAIQKLQQEKLFIRKKICLDCAKAQTKVKQIPLGFAINDAKYTFNPISKILYYQTKENPRPSQQEIVSRQIENLVVQESGITIYFKSPNFHPLVVHCVVQN